MPFGEMKLITGNSNPKLAHDICDYLEISLGKAQVFKFQNDNTFVKILENVRERDVFVVQPMSSPVNDSIIELLIMIDALKRASAARITAVLPYFAYGRSDKKDQPRVPITARLMANLIETAGADRVLTIDLHAGQIQGFFNIPVDELTAVPMLANTFRDRGIEDLVVVATDVGGAGRARETAGILNAPIAIMDKRRIGNDDTTATDNLIGNVTGKTAFIIDDEISTGGTVVNTAELVMAHGAKDVYCAATHPVLCGDAPQNLNASRITEYLFTDTLPSIEGEMKDKIINVSVAPLLGEAIRRIHSGTSVGELFAS